MAQEEHGQKYSNSSSGGGATGSGGGGGGGGGVSGGNNGTGGGRSQKKMKQKKIPQRGLGVAQLERIRLEEQQKKGAVLQASNVLSSNQIISPTNSSSCLAVQCPSTFRPCISSSSSAPLPPPSPGDLPSPNSIFRPSPSIPNVDILHPNSVPLFKSLNMDGGEIGWSAVTVPGQGTWPKVWNGEYSLDGKNRRLDHLGFGYRSNVHLPFESSNPTPFLPLPNLLQRSQQFQQSSSSSMVNSSSGMSSSPSPVLNFPMEPPSNQNFCASNYTPLWPDEEKMIGMKRPCPFSMETPPAPAFHFKYPPSYVAPISRLDEPASCSNRCNVSNEPGLSVIRESPLIPSTLSEPTQTEVRNGENGSLNGDFLTLAPPAAASPHLLSQHKKSLANLGPQSFSEFESQPNQGSSEDAIQGQWSSKSMRPPFFSFFPSAKKEIGQAPAPANHCNGEVGENVDLSLKL